MDTKHRWGGRSRAKCSLWCHPAVPAALPTVYHCHCLPGTCPADRAQHQMRLLQAPCWLRAGAEPGEAGPSVSWWAKVTSSCMERGVARSFWARTAEEGVCGPQKWQ